MNQPNQPVSPAMAIVRRAEAALLALPLSERVYLASIGALVVGGLVAAGLSLGPLASLTVVMVGTHGFLVGFVLATVPRLRELWPHAAGKAVVGVLNVVALLVATALARYHVSVALGLPAHDFDLTVAAFTLLFYVPAWSLLVAACLLPVLLLLLAAAVHGSFSKEPGRAVARRLAHCVGALGVCIYASQLFDWSARETRAISVAIRATAMVCDYQPASKNPGLRNGERVRLHENGVVSTIVLGPGGPTVSVRKLGD